MNLGEAKAPRIPPERGVNEVNAVIEDIPPFGRGDGAADKLPVNGIKHHENEPGRYAAPEISLLKKTGGIDDSYPADRRHHIGRLPDPGPQARKHHPTQNRRIG